MSTKKLLTLLSKPALFYQIQQEKVRNMEQHKHAKKSVRIDHAKIERSVEHLTIWMIRTYGSMADDKSCRFVLTKEDFKTRLVGYLEEYADCKGILK